MTAATAATAGPRGSSAKRVTSEQLKVGAWLALLLLLILAVTLGTTFVGDGSQQASGPQAFSADQFGQQNFAKVQAGVIKRAVPAATLFSALQADLTGATSKYSVPVAGAPGPEFSVTFSGVVGTGDSGIYPVQVSGLPTSLVIRVQTGPAINGTDLRDATGLFSFGQFTNQIDYQNAAAALNDQMKKQVLATVDAAHLTGKTVTVSGAFQLINPNGWLVTPASLSVAK